MLDSQRLGAILLRSGSITEKQLQAALDYRARRHCRLGEALLSLGLCTEAQVARGLADQLGMPFVDLEDTPPSPRALGLIQRERAVQLGIVPVEVRPDGVLVVARNPFDFSVDAAARRAVGQPVIIACGVDAQIVRVLEEYNRLLAWSPPPVASEGGYVAKRVEQRRGVLQLSQLRGETVSLDKANEALDRYLAAGGTELELEIADDLVSFRGRQKSRPVRIIAVPRGNLRLRIVSAAAEGEGGKVAAKAKPAEGTPAAPAPYRLRATLSRA